MLTVRYVDENNVTHTVQNVQRIFLQMLYAVPYLYIERMNDETGKGVAVRMQSFTSWDATETVSGGDANLLL